MAAYLVCGVEGLELSREERELLERLAPGGVMVFSRNVATAEQLRGLIAQLRALPSSPYVAVDLEGGRVNRLERLLGPLPSPARAGGRGEAAVRALGAACGAACAHFGIGLDLAPVLDVAWSKLASTLGGEERCFGREPQQVGSRARTFLRQLRKFGVGGCLKHYPGLGSGVVDSHQKLPTLTAQVEQEAELFHSLLRPDGAVMMAHALAPSLGEKWRPASLSPRLVGRVTRRAGLVVADDLEMGALSGFGTLGERAVEALLAGVDQVLVCNALAAREEVVEAVERERQRNWLLERNLRQASRRVAAFSRKLQPREVRWDRVKELWEMARKWGGGEW